MLRVKGRGKSAPSLGDDDVVEGGMAFAEAGEADFEDHYLVFWGGEEGEGSGWSRYLRRKVQDAKTFALRGRITPQNAR